VCCVSAAYGRGVNILDVPLHTVSPQKDGALLRRVMFGGEPFVSFCAERQANEDVRLDKFIREVRQELAKDKSHDIQMVKVPCGETFKSGKTTLQKTFKLKREHATLPVLFWTVNGDSQQIKAKTFTSPVNNKGGTKGAVELDAAKLGRSLVRAFKPKLTPLSTNDKFTKECLELRYRVCAVLLKHGGVSKLAPRQKEKLLNVARKNRHVRYFVVDTKTHTLSNVAQNEFDKTGTSDEAVIMFKRTDYTHSGDPARITVSEEQARKATEAAEKKQKKKELLRQPCTVPNGQKVKVSLGMAEISKASNAEARHSVFKKYTVKSSQKLDLGTQRKKLAVLYSRGTKGYILDWDAAQEQLLLDAAFDKKPSLKQLADLQEATLLRFAPKDTKRASANIHLGTLPNGISTSEKKHEAFIKAFISNAQSRSIPFAKRPSLSKLVTRQSAPKTKKVRKPKKQTTSKAFSHQEQIEREHKRRMEMEEETRQSGAFAMPNDEHDDEEIDDNEDEDAEEISLDESQEEVCDDDELNLD